LGRSACTLSNLIDTSVILLANVGGSRRGRWVNPATAEDSQNIVRYLDRHGSGRILRHRAPVGLDALHPARTRQPRWRRPEALRDPTRYIASDPTRRDPPPRPFLRRRSRRSPALPNALAMLGLDRSGNLAWVDLRRFQSPERRDGYSAAKYKAKPAPHRCWRRTQRPSTQWLGQAAVIARRRRPGLALRCVGVPSSTTRPLCANRRSREPDPRTSCRWEVRHRT
jgi:hypothetical protein